LPYQETRSRGEMLRFAEVRPGGAPCGAVHPGPGDRLPAALRHSRPLYTCPRRPPAISSSSTHNLQIVGAPLHLLARLQDLKDFEGTPGHRIRAGNVNVFRQSDSDSSNNTPDGRYCLSGGGIWPEPPLNRLNAHALRVIACSSPHIAIMPVEYRLASPPGDL
jgi:hypothetical protein